MESLVTLKSLTPAYGGYSLARDEKIIFIRGAVPGELVEVKIEEKKRDYSVASVVSVLEPSEFRIEPRCPVFGECGGCHLQFISHEKQVVLKDEVLSESLARIGGIETALLPALTGQQWHYRHRAQFKIARDGSIGFFRESSREVVPVEECPLMSPAINAIYKAVRDRGLHRNFTEIHIAGGETPVAVLRGQDYDPSLDEQFIEAGLSGIAFQDSIVYGGATTSFGLCGIRYTVSPWTFFQSHWDLNTALTESLVQLLSPLEGRTVLDLYAGAGNFSLPLAHRGADVIAVEENPRAVEDGLRNIELNGIAHAKMVKSSAERYRMQKKYSVLLLDPPRLGLTSEVAKKVLENAPETIVYISCNPATLARDLKKLKEKYDLKSVRQIDFFPHTYHIESISVLQLR